MIKNKSSDDKSSSHSIIPKILGVFLISGIALFSIYFTQVPRETEKTTDYQQQYQILSLALSELWESGEHSSIPDLCEELRYSEKLVHSDFYRCNPSLFECLIKKNKSISLGKSSYQLVSFLLDTKLRPIATFKNNDELFKLRLSYTCLDTYLPEKLYSAGPKGIDLRWDNFDQFVYIDKNYVSNLLVGIWNNKKYQDLYKPNTTLSFNEKKQFCQSMGKQLLESRFLDAASFYPEQKDGFFYKHPYPWTKERRSHKENIKSSDCGNLYSKECESIRPYQFSEPLGVTWMGIANSLGNYPEVVENKFRPKMNLVPSSFYQSWNSKKNEVGIREVLKENDKEMKGAFRCMSIY
jgi:hypothetical protein